jgi:hypothetical protein
LYTLTDLSDYTLYHVKHVIMPLQLNLVKERVLEEGGRVAGSAVFKLHDTDKRALDQHIKDMMLQMSPLAGKQGGGRVREQRKVQVPVVGEVAEGLSRVGGPTSRAGRKTTTLWINN